VGGECGKTKQPKLPIRLLTPYSSQGWIVKEKVIEIISTTAQKRQREDIIQKLTDAGLTDVRGNMMHGTTVSNSTVRWILIE